MNDEEETFLADFSQNLEGFNLKEIVHLSSMKETFLSSWGDYKGQGIRHQSSPTHPSCLILNAFRGFFPKETGAFQQLETLGRLGGFSQRGKADILVIAGHIPAPGTPSST